MLTGNIPKKLRLFIRPETTAFWRWEDVDDGKRETKVRCAYISDADNKKTCETGKQWGNQNYYDHILKQSVKAACDEVEVDNVPFSGLKVVTLEIRDKGGRAYKVMADIGGVPNVYFDMREDVLLDCMFNGSLKKEGKISGQFVFARVGAQMKPVRIGSVLHKKMVAATAIDAQAPCILEIGGIYESKNGDRAVYMGEYWTRDIPKIDKYEYRGGVYAYDTCGLRVGQPIKVHVFNNSWILKYPTQKDSDSDAWFYLKDIWEDSYGRSRVPTLKHKKGDICVYDLQVVKSHSYKKKVGDMPVPSEFLDKVITEFAKENPAHLNSPQCQHGKLLCLSLEKGHVHPLMKQFEATI